MRVLVTGASGFGGGQLARRLARVGFEVLALSRGAPATPPEDPTVAKRFHAVRGALDVPQATLPAADVVVHVAATSPWAGVTVDRMVTDNVLGTQRLITHARATGGRLFVFYSSLSVFGKISAPAVNETLPVVSPDAYGVTKLMGETMLADVAAELPSLSIRLPAVIGRGSWRNWLSETRRKLAAGQPVTYFNPEAPFNNGVHEADLADLVERAIATPPRGAEMVVAGSSGETTVRGAVTMLAEAVGSRSVVTASAEPRPFFTLDTAKAQALYGWRPMHIRDALARYLADPG